MARTFDTDDHDHVELFGEVALARDLSPQACHEIALLLAARAVPHRAVEHAGGAMLLVPTRYASKARRELARYRTENHEWPPEQDVLPQLTRGDAVVVILIGLLLSAYAVQSTRFHGIDWIRVGCVDGLAIRSGAFERLITPLLLHGDVVHLAGNVGFGALLLAALAQSVGSGTALLLSILSGALGNAISMLLHEPAFTAIGFSTAVFGALGALVGMRIASKNRAQWNRLQRFAPLFAAIFLFSMIGIGDERTDVLGHVGGMVAGLGVGAAFERSGLRQADAENRTARELGTGLAALGLLVGAWAIALLR